MPLLNCCICKQHHFEDRHNALLLQGQSGDERYRLDILRAASLDDDGTGVAIKEALPALLACTLQVLSGAEACDSTLAGVDRAQHMDDLRCACRCL